MEGGVLMNFFAIFLHFGFMNLVSGNCSDKEYTCPNGACIPRSLLCDGMNDCGDNTDERLCQRSVHRFSSAHRCDNHHFIHQSLFCNGNDDCGDNSDETSCTLQTCSGYLCPNYKCISQTLKCDGKNDCDEGNDEMFCHSKAFCSGSSDYLCSNNMCIHKIYLCDGFNDCGDNSDERSCNHIPCHEHTCPNRKCIPNSWLCDGENDCGDNSDESTCHSYVTTIPTPKVSLTTTRAQSTLHTITTQYTELLNVRLVNGPSATEGRVEVRHNGVWGTVCDDGWDDNDAKVVCRMLGYDTSNVDHRSKAYYGRGTGPIWLDETECTGQETNLGKCTFITIGHGDCDHTEDAGVVCGNAPIVSTTRGTALPAPIASTTRGTAIPVASLSRHFCQETKVAGLTRLHCIQ